MKTFKVNFRPVRVWGPDEAPDDENAVPIHIGERTGPLACYVEHLPGDQSPMDGPRMATAAERFTKRKWRAWSSWEKPGIGALVGLLKAGA